LCVLLNLFISPELLYFWLFAIVSFFFIFFVALNYFKAPKSVYAALVRIPKFISLQVLSLFKAKKANEISTATVHYYDREIDEANKSDH